MHLLDKLLWNDNIAHVFCLVRAPDSSTALARVREALDRNRVMKHLDAARHLGKLSAFPCDFSAPSLGLTPPLLNRFRSTVTHIIHNAWSVNFNQSLRSFEAQSIHSTHFLLVLATSPLLSAKPVFTFVSSIAAALRAGSDDQSVAEIFHPWEAVEDMGYAQSKWVGEQIPAAAAVHAHLLVRVGQVCGDTTHGIWNPAEAIPIVVQAALTIGALPGLGAAGHDEELSWLPVDVTAQALMDLTMLTGHRTRQGVFHVVNERRILWNAEFWPFLRQAGLEFQTVSHGEWVDLLQASDQDVKRNPPVRLLEFFRKRYGGSASSSSSSSATGKEAIFGTETTRDLAPVLRGGVVIDAALVEKFVKHWTEECWKVQSLRTVVQLR